jgi:hypothetical protein
VPTMHKIHGPQKRLAVRASIDRKLEFIAQLLDVEATRPTVLFLFEVGGSAAAPGAGRRRRRPKE